MLRRRAQPSVSGLYLVHDLMEIRAGEFPLEGFGNGFVILLEKKQSILEILKGREVVWSKGLALDNGEVDFDLVEPTGMDRAVYGDDVGKGGLETLDGGLAAMRGAVVNDPEDAAGVAVRGLVHDLCDQAIKWVDAGGFLAPAKELRSVNVEGGQIGPGAAAAVLMFDAGGLSLTRRQRRVPPDSGLDTVFLVGTDDEIVGFEGVALPLPAVEVQDAPRLRGEVRVAGKYPAAMLPGADGVFVEPSPYRLVTDGCNDAAALCLAHDVCAAQA